ncbi:MAG: hypothetical protein Kow0077_19130 [Anaerolineae bacterium]
MFGYEAEVRTFTLGDLPLIYRLKSRGISMDSESYLSRGLHTVGDAALSRLPPGSLGTPTVVARYGREHGFGQLRHAPESADAHIVFMAPQLTEPYTHLQETVWLALLDGLTMLAGERGALSLHAEVDENSAMFEALRRAGFATFTRQDLWLRQPDGGLPTPQNTVYLRPARPADKAAVRFLHAQIVPRLAQPADPIPNGDGLVYVCGGEVRGYLAVRAGNRGIYLRPYVHEADLPHLPAILTGALWMVPRTTALPVYCCVRQYQPWLEGPLAALGFAPWARQTVMVRHTAARVERPAFADLSAVQGGYTLHGPNHC